MFIIATGVVLRSESDTGPFKLLVLALRKSNLGKISLDSLMAGLMGHFAGRFLIDLHDPRSPPQCRL
jgi:hypothetical protein